MKSFNRQTKSLGIHKIIQLFTLTETSFHNKIENKQLKKCQDT